MFKKILPWLIMVFIAITLIVIGAFILWEFIMKDAQDTHPNHQVQDIVGDVEAVKLSAAERAELTYNLPEVTTNLADINYMVLIRFAFVVENEKTLKEIELLEPLVLDTVFNTLSDTQPEEINGSQGKDLLKAKLINQINPILREGNIREINLSNFIITRR